MPPIYVAFIAVGALLVILLIALFLYLSNNLISISKYTLESEKISKGVMVVQISDLHGKSFGKDNCTLIKKVKNLSPDIIVITGDIIHKYRDKDIAVALKTVSGLSKIAVVLYASGNHEMRSVRYKSLRGQLIESGACVLDNCSWQGFGLCVCGVNCADIKKGGFKSIPRADDKFNLLLAHLPQYINEYSSAMYDCVLCGHAHGGQWRVPFTNVGLYAPGQGLFPEYTAGKHVCDGTVEIISRGLGNSQFPLRLFNRPNLVSIDIKSK